MSGTVSLELLSAENDKVTTAEKWFMGNNFVIEKDITNPLKYKLTSTIPNYTESMQQFFRANYIPYVLYDDVGTIINQATFYPRSYLRTPAFTQLSQGLSS